MWGNFLPLPPTRMAVFDYDSFFLPFLAPFILHRTFSEYIDNIISKVQSRSRKGFSMHYSLTAMIEKWRKILITDECVLQFQQI